MGAFTDLQGSQGLTDKVHTVAGDIVTGDGYELPKSIEDAARLVPTWAAAWCNNHGVENPRKMSPLVFRGLCLDIGKAIKASKILYDTRVRPQAGQAGSAGNTCNAYNPAAVLDLYGVFERLCAEYGLIPFATSFAAFCGVSVQYIKEYNQALTSVGLDISQRTRGAELDAIRQKVSDNPVGGIAILNNELWNNSGAIDDRRVESVASLPKFGAIE